MFITKLLLSQRHRWCVEEQRIFASSINTLLYFITKQCFARFLKTFFYQSFQQHIHYGSVALCAFGTSVRLSFMLSPPCSPTLCVTFICSRLTLSLQIPVEPFFFLYISGDHCLSFHCFEVYFILLSLLSLSFML